MWQGCARAQLRDGNCPAANSRMNPARSAIGTQTTQALATNATLLGAEGDNQDSMLLGSVRFMVTVQHLLHAVQISSGLRAGVHLGVV